MEIKTIKHFSDESVEIDFDQIHYYSRKNEWVFDRFNSDTYDKEQVFDIVALVPKEDQTFEKYDCIGMIELQYNRKNQMLELCFIEVSLEYQRKGISKLLLSELVNLMHTHYPGKRLYRSAPGERCPADFTEFVSSLLNKESVLYSTAKDSVEEVANMES